MGEPAPVAVTLPHVASYWRMALPPSKNGGRNVIVIEPSRPSAETFLGVPGLVTAAMNLPSPLGSLPTGTVAVTVCVARSMTDTLLPVLLATYTLVPRGCTLTP